MNPVKLFLLLCLPTFTFTSAVSAATPHEATTLSLVLTQLDILESTLQRAEHQATVTPETRFFFDYPQAYADIRAIRAGTEQYLTPARAQPQTVLPLSGQYRQEKGQ
ncbi:hypothetical protein FKH18_24015 [Salmonella enterica]|uniref:Conjugal transfer protein n=2 Tax=Salmonella enterica TaxID=28901 RepID=A0A619I3L1_SALER|nr:hypothetical protein [Salmonella enterica]EBV8497108.1 hypothetical protein [Salmonella enterica subsp. enterica serovar Java]ECF1924125.1 hypothetical protein [Salmonella enterica subsp. enterica serovar Newport]ECJ2363457.1 hypothetical protein [Salmonella enterica subsp. diarizonae]EAT8555854.1 hypothetical protein [Salmonella enterica]